MTQQDKRYSIKIYASNGTTFRKTITTVKPSDLTLPHVKNKITFRSKINGGLGDTLLVSHIREAISSATGESDHDLKLPTADVDAASNQLLTFGGCVWQ